MSIQAFERTLRLIDSKKMVLNETALMQRFRELARSTPHADDHAYLAEITEPYVGLELVIRELLPITSVSVHALEQIFFLRAPCGLPQDRLLNLLTTIRLLRPDVYENILGNYVELHKVFTQNWSVLGPAPLGKPN